jgi:hypothetical protein
MEKSAQSRKPEQPIRVDVTEDTLLCKHTPAGLWICCSERQPDHCALGLTPLGAAVNWERARVAEE